MTDSVDTVVVGAGPAGLRAAQVLAEGGREVVVLEKNSEVGPKTCAGGLTLKSVFELSSFGPVEDLGLARPSNRRASSDHDFGEVGLARPFLTEISFRGERPAPMDPSNSVVHTVARRALGAWQLSLTLAAGAEVLTGVVASQIDLESRSLMIDGRRVRFRSLIGADGATSGVRRALGLPNRREIFAGEYNVYGVQRDELIALCDSAELGGGYFWVFPHAEYTSVGAMVHKDVVAPGRVRPYLERRLVELGIDRGETPYEGAIIGTEYVGVEFPNSTYLVGDAAGLASSLSGEGIYAALISGEEVARSILEPGYPRPKLESWLRSKAVQDAVARLWLRRGPRLASFAILPLLFRQRWTRRWISHLLLRP